VCAGSGALRARGGGRQVSHIVLLSGCGPLSHRSLVGQAQERTRTAKNITGSQSVNPVCCCQPKVFGVTWLITLGARNRTWVLGVKLDKGGSCLNRPVI
jgi:hypothetical protein